MNTFPTTDLTAPYLYQELVNDRIQTLHREAREYRLAARISRVQRARRGVRKANERLLRALSLEG
ncbi:hypothetical protein ACBI99_29345 [Nonomuraea sp. ATR24]|uniref:hypothetical protein n=1 Tax=Nonomuraea TaxID=83681 RepID=UPI001C5E84F8|nr:hypothetical protein [Nonomuraea ceibae]